MALEELKQRQGVIWGSAPFEKIADQISVMHHDLVARLDPQPGQRWLDLGTGTGAVAFRAARAGAGSAFQWGDDPYVEALLSGDFELKFHEGDSPQVGESGDEIWIDYVGWYGPSKALHDSLEPERRAELNRTMAEFFERFRGEDGIHQSRPYLVVLGTRR